MGITKEDLAKIPAALTINGLEPSEWALFYLVMVDLGVSSEKLKEIKELKRSKEITDSEAISCLLENWVENKKDKRASLEDLISTVASNMDTFPGLAKQDFVGKLNKIRKEIENVSILSAMEAVFNSVDLIRAEIYKYLSIFDKRCLRLTSKSIWNSTLSNWRKTVQLRIGSVDGARAISMEEFYEINVKQEGGNGSYELGKLIEHPFTNFLIFRETINPFRETWTESYAHFWTKCAPHITSLHLSECSYYEHSFLPTYIWLVTKACPKIEQMTIFSNEEGNHPLDDKYVRECENRYEEDDINGNEDNGEDNPFNYRQILKCIFGEKTPDFSEAPQGIANNLKILSLDRYDSCYDDSNLILDVAPNLKSLRISDANYLKGLQSTEREICKLNCISIRLDEENSDDFTALQTYTKTFPIKHFRLDIHDWEDWSDEDDVILQSVFQCGFALVTLNLCFWNYVGDENDKLWLNQLRTVEFPVLKKLHLKFHNNSDMIYFDFSTLRKTPNLRNLSIEYAHVKPNLERFKGARDYAQDSASLKENPLVLDKLEEFCFDGWLLNKNDLLLFRAWFPSLKHLTVGFKENVFSPDLLLLPIYEDLKSLTLTEKCEFMQDDLIAAKVVRPEVRIFIQCSNLGHLEAVKADTGELNVVFKPVEPNFNAILKHLLK